MGPVLTVPPAQPSDEQLARIRAVESVLGLSLVAVRSGGGGAGSPHPHRAQRAGRGARESAV